MGGIIYLIGHKDEGSRSAERREPWNDFPVSIPPAVRAMIDSPGGSSYNRLRVIKPYGTLFKVEGGNNNVLEVTLISTGGRFDEKGISAAMHNMTTLGIFNPETGEFTPPAVHIKELPQPVTQPQQS